MSVHIIELPAAVGFVVALLVANYAWRRRSPGSGLFALVMLAVALWSFASAVEIALVSFPAMLFWAKIKYFGIVVIPLGAFAFALRFTGRTSILKPGIVAALAVVPVATVVLVWTNELHGLIWREIWLDDSGPVALLDSVHGTGFWIHTAYSYLLLALAVVVLVAHILSAPALYRRQAVAIIVGLTLPLAANVLFLFGLSSFPNVDITPFLFTITGIVLGLGFFRYRLLDLVPIARNTVIETMRDGAIVLDGRDRIVDMNAEVTDVTGMTKSELIGRPAFHAMPDAHPPVDEILGSTIDGRAHAELSLDRSGVRRYFSVHVSPLLGPRREELGRVMHLYDITDLKQTEQALRRSESDNRALLEAIPDIIVRVGLDGNVIDVLSPANHSFPIDPGRLHGENLQMLPRSVLADTSPDVVDGIMQAIRRAADLQRPEVYEFSLSSDDIETWWEARIVVSREDEAIAIVRDVTDRKRAQEVREKQTLLTEIHHRVKNNLQVVSSLLLLQSQEIEDPQIRRMFEDTQGRVRTMGLIHEQLYQSESLKGVNLADYIGELVENLVGSSSGVAHNVGIELDADPVVVDLAKATPCGLIIHEIVSNSLKHAFPDGREGTIRVELRDGERIRLTIADNGVGLPESGAASNAKSIGLHMIDALVDQIDASMDIDRQNGTKYTIEFLLS